MPIPSSDSALRRPRRRRAWRLGLALLACGAASLLPGGALASDTGGGTTASSSTATGGTAYAPPPSEPQTRRSRRSVRLPAVLRRIAQCESGGNPRAVSADGRYRGKYQFDVATWRSLGGRGDPARAPEWVQDRLALRLYRRAGTAPWANCA